MTAVLSADELQDRSGRRIPLDRIAVEASEVNFGLGVRAVVGSVVYLVGRVVGAAVASMAWAVAAWKVGYRDGRGKVRGR